jgi:hypothetical protein
MHHTTIIVFNAERCDFWFVVFVEIEFMTFLNIFPIDSHKFVSVKGALLVVQAKSM